MKEMVGGCCVCSDERGWSENPLVYCDGQGCTVAVHQACYGIVTVPTGPWYCRKCESQERSARVFQRCELCPSRDGALKRTDNGGWAHVVCALYIPEVRFGNVTTMEPIILQLIPAERFSKLCYICEETGKGSRATVGACMQCNKTGCKQQFHVTCAQTLGLLCEEAGNYLDNVKYCGYCQHHYAKLKKSGNVKPIPPYKPVSTDNHSSDSSPEKESDTPSVKPGVAAAVAATAGASSTTSGKRKSSSSSSKPSSSKASTPSVVTASKAGQNLQTHQKSVHSSGSAKLSASSEKINKSLLVVDSSSVKSAAKVDSEHIASVVIGVAESGKADKNNGQNNDTRVADIAEKEPIILAPKGSNKKRKVGGSRTPTPSPNVTDGASVVVTTSAAVTQPQTSSVISAVSAQATSTNESNTDGDKTKKLKTEHPTTTVVTSTVTLPVTSTESIPASSSNVIQTSAGHSPSLVVSVPLSNATLNPITTVAPTLFQQVTQQSGNGISIGNLSVTLEPLNHSMFTDTNSESPDLGGGLKITYEKQTSLISSAANANIMSQNVESNEDVPGKRIRSQSTEKSEKVTTRGKKRGSAGPLPTVNNCNSVPLPAPVPSPIVSKRSSRSQHTTPSPAPSPQQTPQGAFSSINNVMVTQVKESPPSSPGSESTNTAPVTVTRRSKGRRSGNPPVNINTNSQDSKDTKVFQNGINAPHMLGNQLNPTSHMAQKMSDHLNSELEAHSIFNSDALPASSLVGPQLHSRVIASVRSNTNTSTTYTTVGGSSNVPQTLDQLLERQWEQGSQFLMEQAQHFDIASLLSCLHQLRAENLRLEEHVSSLLQRRDHLLAVNARLAIPLTNPSQQPVPVSSQPTVMNNIHPAVVSSTGRTYHGNHVPMENGLPTPPDVMHGGTPGFTGHGNQIRASQHSQQSPTIRHSQSSNYTVSGSQQSVVRGSSSSNANVQRSSSVPDTARGSTHAGTGHPQYVQYQGQVPVVTTQHQQQMVIRRDSEIHHQMTAAPGSGSKPS